MPHGLFRRQTVLVWLLGAAVVSVFLVNTANTVADPDLWGYLAFGRQFWNHGFPYQDIFSYAPVRETWVYHEWLTGVVFYKLFLWLGFPGIQLAKLAALALALAAIYRTAVIRGADRAVALALLVLTCFASRAFSAPTRAQVLTILCFCLTLLVVELRLDRRDSRLLWWLWPLNLVWGNLHGGFVVGLALAGSYALFSPFSWRTKLRDCGLVVGSGLITAINPYGLGYWRYLASALSKNREHIPEWSSVITALGNPAYRETAWLILGLIGLLLAGWLAARRKKATDAVTILLFGAAALAHIRNGVFLAVLASAYLPAFFSPVYTEIRQSLPRGARALTGLLLAGCCLALVAANGLTLGRTFSLDVSLAPLAAALPPDREPPYPVAALDFIERHGLRGNMLCFFNWGEYLLWKFSPALKVGMDGRYETVYTEAYEREYTDFLAGRGDWKKAISAYPVDFVFLPVRVPAAGLLRQDPDWPVLYQDDHSILFRRKDQASPRETPAGSAGRAVDRPQAVVPAPSGF